MILKFLFGQKEEGKKEEKEQLTPRDEIADMLNRPPSPDAPITSFNHYYEMSTDDKWKALNTDRLKHAQNMNWGFYSCITYEMYKVLMERKQYERALDLLLERCYLDVNGPGNVGVNSIDPEIRMEILAEFPGWESSEYTDFAPANVEEIAKLSAQLNIPLDDIQEKFRKIAEKYYENIKLPVPPKKNWPSKNVDLPVSPETAWERLKDALTKPMADMALRAELKAKIIELIKSQPGILQKDVYKILDIQDKGMARDILYFMESTGDIRREKKGSSYKLFPGNNLHIDGIV